jgi:hypothetical protein
MNNTVTDLSGNEAIDLFKNERSLSLKLEDLSKENEGHYTCSLKYDSSVNKTFYLAMIGTKTSDF